MGSLTLEKDTQINSQRNILEGVCRVIIQIQKAAFNQVSYPQPKSSGLSVPDPTSVKLLHSTLNRFVLWT